MGGSMGLAQLLQVLAGLGEVRRQFVFVGLKAAQRAGRGQPRGARLDTGATSHRPGSGRPSRRAPTLHRSQCGVAIAVLVVVRQDLW